MKVKILSAMLAGLMLLGGIVWSRFGEMPPGRAPAVVFTTLAGEKIDLRRLRGHPVLVAFWASDCRSCITEMPELAALYNDLSRKGFKMIAVAMYYDPPSHVVAMARDKALPYPVALDPLAKIAGAFRVRVVPTRFLIAPDGTVAMHRTGLPDMAELRTRIVRMLPKG